MNEPLYRCECGLICRKMTVWTCPLCGSGKPLCEIPIDKVIARYNEVVAAIHKGKL